MSEQDVWYKEGLCFSCTQCGNCCSGEPGYVWVTQEEIRRIALFLGRQNGRLTRDEVRRVGFKQSLTEKASGECVFLKKTEDGKRICSVYPVRPLQCRTWPFWSYNLYNESAWADSARTCPGMNHGRLHTVEDIKRQLARRAPQRPEDPDP